MQSFGWGNDVGSATASPVMALQGLRESEGKGLEGGIKGNTRRFSSVPLGSVATAVKKNKQDGRPRYTKTWAGPVGNGNPPLTTDNKTFPLKENDNNGNATLRPFTRRGNTPPKKKKGTT